MMSQGLRKMTEDQKKRAITRRLKHKTGGLGYWAAIDAQKFYAGSLKQVSAKKG